MVACSPAGLYRAAVAAYAVLQQGGGGGGSGNSEGEEKVRERIKNRKHMGQIGLPVCWLL